MKKEKYLPKELEKDVKDLSYRCTCGKILMAGKYQYKSTLLIKKDERFIVIGNIIAEQDINGKPVITKDF